MGEVAEPSDTPRRRAVLPRWDLRRRGGRAPATPPPSLAERPSNTAEPARPVVHREREWRATPLRWVVLVLAIVWVAPIVAISVYVGGSGEFGVLGVLLLLAVVGFVGCSADRWTRTATRIVLHGDGTMEIRAPRTVVHTTITGVHGIVEVTSPLSTTGRRSGWALQTSGGTIRVASDLVEPDLVRVLRRANPDLRVPEVLRRH